MTRFYSPYINRFLQPDTIIPDLSNPQSWNRFSYVENNPIIKNDPTGHFANILIGALAGGLIGAGVDILVQAMDKGFDQVDYKEVAGAFVAGAVAGAIVSCAPMLAGAIVNTGVSYGTANVTAAFTVGAVGNVIGNQAGAAVEAGLSTRPGENYWKNYAEKGGIYNGESVTNLDKVAVDFVVGGTLNAGFSSAQHLAAKKFMWVDDPFISPSNNYNPVEFAPTGNGTWSLSQQPTAKLPPSYYAGSRAGYYRWASNKAFDSLSEYTERRIEKKLNME